MQSDNKRVVKYMQIVQYIEDRINENTLKPGDLLPSQEELMECIGLERTAGCFCDWI